MFTACSCLLYLFFMHCCSSADGSCTATGLMQHVLDKNGGGLGMPLEGLLLNFEIFSLTCCAQFIKLWDIIDGYAD